ncbi:MAG: hypothetical protein ACJAQ3_003957, partial [Planctomycetota bacterium]
MLTATQTRNRRTALLRRVLERSGLNPRQLGLPPRPGEEGTDASLDSS